MTMIFEAVLFDCDGVLVDSEPITMAVLRDMLAQAGWDMPLAECMAEFVGVTVRSKAALIEARTGRPLTDAWMAEFYERRNAALQADLKAIAAATLLRYLSQYPWKASWSWPVCGWHRQRASSPRSPCWR